MAAGWNSDSPLPRFSLSSLWSSVDALFLLTTSQNSERKERVWVSWKKSGWRPSVNLNYSRVHSCDVLLHLIKPEKFLKLHSVCVSSYLPHVRLLSHPQGLRVQWLHRRSISLDDLSSLTLSSIKAFPADGWVDERRRRAIRSTPQNVPIHPKCKEGSECCPAIWLCGDFNDSRVCACFGIHLIKNLL